MDKALYREDFFLWSVEQGRAIREAGAARINAPVPVDWENVAEEIESLGRSQRSTVRSHIFRTIVRTARRAAEGAVERAALYRGAGAGGLAPSCA